MKWPGLMLLLAVVGCGGEPPGKSRPDNNGATNNAATNNAVTNNVATNNTATNNTATNNVQTTNNGTASCFGCSSDGDCVQGAADDACGYDGGLCTVCADGWECFDGECTAPSSCTPQNCAGCCDATGGCRAGNADEGCGFDGGACATCTGTESCHNGACERPCAETCAGCCVGEVCMIGTEDGNCGVSGATCVPCASNSSCSDGGSCVADSCATSCAGCCNGSTCETGASDGACGSAGDMCAVCGAGRTCESGTCVVGSTSRWELVLVAGRVSDVNPMGESWDTLNSLPDPVVDVTLYDSTTTTSYRNTSTIAQNDATPVWNESQLTGVPAEAFRKWTLDVWDSDFDADDPFCEARPPDEKRYALDHFFANSATMSLGTDRGSAAIHRSSSRTASRSRRCSPRRPLRSTTTSSTDRPPTRPLATSLTG